VDAIPREIERHQHPSIQPGSSSTHQYPYPAAVPRPTATERSRINLFRSCRSRIREISRGSLVVCCVPGWLRSLSHPSSLSRLRIPPHVPLPQPYSGSSIYRPIRQSGNPDPTLLPEKSRTHLANNRSDRHLDRMCKDIGDRVPRYANLANRDDIRPCSLARPR
jgi:hypothetical protein